MSNNFKQTIIKNIKKLSGKYNLSEIYSDWIHIMAYSISNSADKGQYDEREQCYMTIIKKYTKEEAQCLADCFSLLVLALEEKQKDWLGEIYMELEIGNKNTAQFFTPFYISQLMAELTFSKNEDKLKEKNWIGYYEPCCGAGSMTIAFALAMEKQKYNYQTQLVVWCEDIDENCLLMTYVQLSLLGIKAICKVKNSILQEEFSTWYTPFYIYFPPPKEVKEEKKQVISKQLKANPSNEEVEQLVLF